jgi:hypothetical protein
MKRLTKRQEQAEQRRKVFEMTLFHLNLPAGTIEGVTNPHYAVDFAESLLRILGIDLHFEQIQQCGKCKTYYLPVRANQTACSSACSHALRQKRYRSVTGSGKNTPRSMPESVI